MSHDATDVVAAVIERDGRYLLGRRPEEKRHGGLWEFPGGKLDQGEDAEGAARRELAEELALRVVSVGPVLHSVIDPAAPFVIHFHPVRAVGDPAPLEHEEVGWFRVEEMRGLGLAPADGHFVAWLSGRSSAP